MSRPPASDRLTNPDAVLTRSDLRELGWERRGIDAIFRRAGVIAVPGYSRPVIRVGDYLAVLEDFTYRGDRVQPGRVENARG
jgi:hypothetical protein